MGPLESFTKIVPINAAIFECEKSKTLCRSSAARSAAVKVERLAELDHEPRVLSKRILEAWLHGRAPESGKVRSQHSTMLPQSLNDVDEAKRRERSSMKKENGATATFVDVGSVGRWKGHSANGKVKCVGPSVGPNTGLFYAHVLKTRYGQRM